MFRLIKWQTENERNRMEFLFGILSIIFGIIALVIVLFVFVIHPSEKSVGERFILDEVTLRLPFYQFHFKPITLFVMFSFLFLVCGAESLYSRLCKLKLFAKQLFFIFFLLTTFVFTYETIQNFLTWTSFYILNQGKMSLDELSHQLNPAMLNPINFLFISKIFSLFLFASLYALYFFYRMMNGENSKQNTKSIRRIQ